jgi:hypothetical protein
MARDVPLMVTDQLVPFLHPRVLVAYLLSTAMDHDSTIVEPTLVGIIAQDLGF